MHLLLAAGVAFTAALLGLLWLTALANGGTLAVPLPFSPEIWLLPQGAALAGFTLLGALLALTVLAAPLAWLVRERRTLRHRLAQREAHLREVLALHTDPRTDLRSEVDVEGGQVV